jgi:hypothetical protein
MKDKEFASNNKVEMNNEDREREKNEKWEKIVDFMRKNPKILIQMIPD